MVEKACSACDCSLQGAAAKQSILLLARFFPTRWASEESLAIPTSREEEGSWRKKALPSCCSFPGAGEEAG